MIEMKYDEYKYLGELQSYIETTYDGHYIGEDNIQALDLIFAAGHGEGFCIGNNLKYSSRYGKKKGYNRDDLMKVLHYTILMLHVHDKRENRISTGANFMVAPRVSINEID